MPPEHGLKMSVFCYKSIYFGGFVGSETIMFSINGKKNKYFWGEQIQLTFEKKSFIQKAKGTFSKLMDAHPVYSLVAVLFSN